MISNPHGKMLRSFRDIRLVPLCLGSLSVSTTDHPFYFLSIYATVSTTLHNHRQKTRPDNPNFKSLMSHYHSNGTVFASLDEIEIVEGVFPGNLLDEFTASLSILSNGYGYLPQSLLRLLF